MTEPDFVLYLGSRSGTTVALGFFCAVLGAINYGVAREWERLGGDRRTGRVVASALFVVLLAIVCASSLGGFYEVRGYPAYLETRALAPMWSSRIAWSDIDRVDARPWSRARWRLSLVDRSGNRIVSATWRREGVEEVARTIRDRLSLGH